MMTGGSPMTQGFPAYPPVEGPRHGIESLIFEALVLCCMKMMITILNIIDFDLQSVYKCSFLYIYKHDSSMILPFFLARTFEAILSGTQSSSFGLAPTSVGSKLGTWNPRLFSSPIP